MSKVLNNPLLKGVSGKLGDTHYYRTMRGDLQMCNLPGPRKRSTAKQKAQMEAFQFATQYAKAQSRNAAAKALYAKGISRRCTSAYAVALSDYLNAPVVHYIRTSRYTGEAGSLITIKATDDFMVTSVQVALYTSDGTLIEEGAAERNKRKGFMWNYRATVHHPTVEGTIIRVVAKDRPGNAGEMGVVMGEGLKVERGRSKV